MTNPLRTLRHAALWSAMLAFLLLAGDVQAQVIINENGGFEQSEAGQTADIAHWSPLLNEGATAEVVEDPDDASNLVLKVTLTDLSVTENPWDIQVVHYLDTELILDPDHEHQMSFRIRAENPADATISLDGQAGAQLWEQSISGADWQTIETNTFAGSVDTSRAIGVHLGFDSNSNGQIFYIDDMHVVDLDSTSASAYPVIVEAESGTLGNEWEIATDEETAAEYITITTPRTDLGYPGAERTASYTVTFPDSGWYDLYARVYVGPDAFDDDSFFMGSDFGTSAPDDPNAWTTVNGLAGIGYAMPDEYVDGLGAVGSEAWKWVNVSEQTGSPEPPDTFYVSLGDLTQTFEIGARENGLWIDKLAFARADYFYTVENLETGTAGVAEIDSVEIELPEAPLAAGTGKFLGNIYSPSQIENFAYYWNQVTPENAGKWGSVEGTRDEMNWGALDAAYALAKDNGYPFRFHVLLWGAQQPDWINDLEPAEQLEEIEEWFQAVADRYPDIEYLEVVNESLPGHNPPDGGGDRADYIDALGGPGETGWDWVITAFEMAERIFPEDTQLMINDYGILGSQQAAHDHLEIAELLQERDLIDVIGVQGHAFSTGPGAPMEAVLDILSSTGLPVMVTEMDVDGNPNVGDITDEDSDINQLLAMQRIFPTLWEHPSVIGITLWGWRPGLWRQDQDAFLVRSEGEPRPALGWLQEYLAEYDPVANEEGEELAGATRLVGSYPNPFGTSTQIRYELAEPADVTLRVYDALGRQVETLVSGYQGAGAYAVAFDGNRHASGVYMYRLEAGSHVETRSMLLVK